ncbi:MAG: hypothetical protein Q8916_13495, partial [Bacteroidota bacterium]|nr:hypothetical protein [Bacteroidota bacterium]
KPLAELKIAIANDPEHLNGLIDYGLFIMGADPQNPKRAGAKAYPYFQRAYEVAVKQGDEEEIRFIENLIKDAKAKQKN